MWNQKRELKSGKSLPHKIRKSQVKAWDFFILIQAQFLFYL